MSKIITIVLLFLMTVMLSASTVSAVIMNVDEPVVVVEFDNYHMPAYYQYAYWEQIYEKNPTDVAANYRLDLLSGMYSTNGRYSGLSAGMEARRIAENPKSTNYHFVTFVNNVPDWKP